MRSFNVHAMTKKHSVLFILLFLASISLLSITACNKNSVASAMTENKPETATTNKVNKLLAQMTLEEKIGQMNQYSNFFDVTGPAPKEGDAQQRYEHIKQGKVGSILNARGAKEVRELQKLAVENSRLGIPLIFGYDVIHGYKTTAPIPLAEAASWDLKAIENSARLAAQEATAAGLNWTFAPMVDISRDARWGRVMEGAGEDPYLGSRIAEARVNGFQGKDLSLPHTIAATAKHFAGYGFAESGKDYNTADVGTSTLYNIILPPFKAAKEAGVRTFMNSFNELNGIPATGDRFLQRDLLKGEWGFDGFIVSDWGSIIEMKDHGYAATDIHAAEIAVTAGSDMDMESHVYIKYLKEMVTSGKIDVTIIDDAVRRILRVKYELGLFDDPYRYCDEKREQEITGSGEQLAGALDMAKKSIVLLKNDNDILPLSKQGKNIAVIGQLAESKNSPLGNWRLGAEDHSATSVMEGLKKYTGNTITYTQGVELYKGNEGFIFELDINKEDKTGITEAVTLAKKSEIVIMVLGEHGYQSGEGRSRADIGLPGLQQELLEAVYEVNKNIVLVLNNGRPLAIEWADNHIPGILEAWQLGTTSGDAIAQVLYGDHNPSGKLPMTFPRDVGQVPIYYNYKNTGRPGPKDLVFWSHYTDQSNTPLYPFGHGLSYADFQYSNLNISSSVTEVKVTVSTTLRNISQVTGEEVVQLYIRDQVGSVTRPVKELKGFRKVQLDSNQEQEIEFVLTEKELGFYNNKGKFII